MSNMNNVAGHRERFAQVSALMPKEVAGRYYVSGGRPDTFEQVGRQERQILDHYCQVSESRIVDVGCGVGRLTQFLKDARSYTGTDVVPEVIEQAKAAGREDFTYIVVDGPEIPVERDSADLVCAFSVITHLLDHEVFNLYRAAHRALAPGGVVIFSYLDFDRHWPVFQSYCGDYKQRPALLKFFEPETLSRFAKGTGFQEIEHVRSGTDPFKFGQHLTVLRKP